MSDKKFCELEIKKLDEEFNELLDRVKKILNDKSFDNIQIYELWLDKLKNTSSQRVLRNKYLTELYRFIKTGNLNGIFNQSPPKSALMPLNYRQNVIINFLFN